MSVLIFTSPLTCEECHCARTIHELRPCTDLTRGVVYCPECDQVCGDMAAVRLRYNSRQKGLTEEWGCR